MSLVEKDAKKIAKELKHFGGEGHGAAKVVTLSSQLPKAGKPC